MRNFERRKNANVNIRLELWVVNVKPVVYTWNQGFFRLNKICECSQLAFAYVFRIHIYICVNMLWTFLLLLYCIIIIVLQLACKYINMDIACIEILWKKEREFFFFCFQIIFIVEDKKYRKIQRSHNGANVKRQTRTISRWRFL